MRILLTGATGFLGSHLLERLLEENHQVVVLKRSTSDTWRIKHRLDQVTSFNVDQQPIEAAFAENKIEAVIHTACHYGRNQDSMSQVIDSNLMFSVKVLEMAIRYNTGTFFNTGTLLPDYLNTYSLSKKQFSEWLKQSSSKIQSVTLKLEHMYGPKDDKTKFVPWLLDKMIHSKEEIKLTKGEQLRDFIFIDDVISAYMVLLNATDTLPSYAEFDVGTAQPITVRSFVETLSHVVEKEIGTNVNQRLNFGAIPYREGELMHSHANITGLKQLNWKVNIPLVEGVKKVITSEKKK